MNVGTLELHLLLNRTSFDRDLRKAERDAVRFNRTKLNLTPQVDHDPLFDLNRHLDVKVRHVDAVNRHFKSNPLKPRVDTSELDRLERRIGGVRGGTIKVEGDVGLGQQSNIDFRSIERSIADNTAPIVSLLEDIKDNTKKDGLIKSALKGAAGATFGASISGGFMGLGMQFATQVTKEAGSGERGKQAREAASRVAARVGDIGFNTSANYAEKLFGAQRKKGNATETMVNDLLTGVETLIDPTLFSEKQQQLRRSFFNIMTKVEAGQMSLADGMTEALKSIYEEAPRQIRNAAFRTAQVASAPFKVNKEYQNAKAARVVEKYSGDIEKATRVVAKQPELQNLEEKGIERVGIAFGGHERKKGANSQQLSEMVRPFADEKTVFVEVKNTFTDRYQGEPQSYTYDFLKDLLEPMGISLEGEAKSMLSNLEVEMEAALKGMNPDAIKGEIIRASLKALFPKIETFYIGFSGGGYPVEQAVSIAEQTGDTETKGLALGTPFFGLTDTASAEQFQSVIGYSDPLTFAFDKEAIEYPDRMLSASVNKLEKKGLPPILSQIAPVVPPDIQTLVNPKAHTEHGVHAYLGTSDSYEAISTFFPWMKDTAEPLSASTIPQELQEKYPQLSKELQGQSDPLYGSRKISKLLPLIGKSNRFFNPKMLDGGLDEIHQILDKPEIERTDKEKTLLNGVLGDINEQIVKNLAEYEATIEGALVAGASKVLPKIAQSRGILDADVKIDSFERGTYTKEGDKSVKGKKKPKYNFDPDELEALKLLKQEITEFYQDFYKLSSPKKHLEKNKAAAVEVLDRATSSELKGLDTEGMDGVQKSSLLTLKGKRETEDLKILRGLDIYKNSGKSDIPVDYEFFNFDNPTDKLQTQFNGLREYVIEPNTKALQGTQYENVTTKYARLLENIQSALARFMITGEAVPDALLTAAETALTAEDKLADFEFPDLISQGVLQTPTENYLKLLTSKGNQEEAYLTEPQGVLNTRQGANALNQVLDFVDESILNFVRSLIDSGKNLASLHELGIKATEKDLDFILGDTDEGSPTSYDNRSKLSKDPKEKNIEIAKDANMVIDKTLEAIEKMGVKLNRSLVAEAVRTGIKNKDIFSNDSVDFNSKYNSKLARIQAEKPQGNKYEVDDRIDRARAKLETIEGKFDPQYTSEIANKLWMAKGKPNQNYQEQRQDYLKAIEVQLDNAVSSSERTTRGLEATSSPASSLAREIALKIAEKYNTRLVNVFPEADAEKPLKQKNKSEADSITPQRPQKYGINSETNTQDLELKLSDSPVENPLISINGGISDRIDTIIDLLSGGEGGSGVPLDIPEPKDPSPQLEPELILAQTGSKQEATGSARRVLGKKILTQKPTPNDVIRGANDALKIRDINSTSTALKVEKLGQTAESANIALSDLKLDELRKLAPMLGIKTTTDAGGKPIKSARKANIVDKITKLAAPEDIQKAIANLQGFEGHSYVDLGLTERYIAEVSQKLNSQSQLQNPQQLVEEIDGVLAGITKLFNSNISGGDRQKLGGFSSQLSQLKEDVASRNIPAVDKTNSLIRPSNDTGYMNVADIQVDPKRFQFKSLQTDKDGATGSLSDIKKFDPEQAGAIQVWKDPDDGNYYVINGHNRLNAAKKFNQKEVRVMEVSADTAEEARAKGALKNIGEGNGSAIDAAKFFRNSDIRNTVDAANAGLSLKKSVANQGLGIANLAPDLFDLTVQQQIPPERAAMIGGSDLSDDLQMQLFKELSKLKSVTNDVIKEMIDGIKVSQTQIVQTLDLFGSNSETQSLFVDRAKVSAAVANNLRSTKTTFGAVSSQKKADLLASGNNIVNPESNKEIAKSADSALFAFEKWKGLAGNVSDLLNVAASRLSQGENEKTVKEQTIAQLTPLLTDIAKNPNANRTDKELQTSLQVASQISLPDLMADMNSNADITAKHWGDTTQEILNNFRILAAEAKDKGYDIQRFISEGSPGTTERIRKHWQTTEKALSKNIGHIQNEAKKSGSAIEQLFSANPELKDKFAEIINTAEELNSVLTSSPEQLEFSLNFALENQDLLENITTLLDNAASNAENIANTTLPPVQKVPQDSAPEGIRVGLSKEYIEAARTGAEVTPTFEENSRGTYLLNPATGTLVTDPKKQVNEHKIGQTGSIFNHQGFNPEEANYPNTTTPGRVALVDGKYELVSKGQLEFSRHKPNKEDRVVQPPPVIPDLFDSAVGFPDFNKSAFGWEASQVGFWERSFFPKTRRIPKRDVTEYQAHLKEREKEAEAKRLADIKAKENAKAELAKQRMRPQADDKGRTRTTEALKPMSSLEVTAVPPELHSEALAQTTEQVNIIAEDYVAAVEEVVNVDLPSITLPVIEIEVPELPTLPDLEMPEIPEISATDVLSRAAELKEQMKRDIADTQRRREIINRQQKHLNSLGSGGSGKPPKPPTANTPEPEEPDGESEVDKLQRQARERANRIAATRERIANSLNEANRSMADVTSQSRQVNRISSPTYQQPPGNRTLNEWAKTTSKLKRKFDYIREQAKDTGSDIGRLLANNPELKNAIAVMENRLNEFGNSLENDYQFSVPFEAGEIDISDIESSLSEVEELVDSVSSGAEVEIDAEAATNGFSLLDSTLSDIHGRSLDIRHIWQQLTGLATNWAQSMQGGEDPLGGLENVYEGYVDAVNNLPNLDDIFGGISDFIDEMSEASPIFGNIVGFTEDLAVAGLGILGFSELSDVIFEGTTQLVEYGREFQRFDRAMSGAGKNGKKVFEELYKTSQEFGTSLTESMAGYTQLSLSVQGTQNEGTVDEIFPGFQQAFASRQATPEQQGRGFLAIEQILSKGNASAEELRQQLSEALPGAFAIAAQSMGMDMEEFTVRLYNAEIAGDEMLRKMAAFYKIDSAILLEISSASFEAELGRLTGKLDKLKTIGGEIIIPPLQVGLQAANLSLELITENAEIFALVMGSVVLKSVHSVLKSIWSVGSAMKLNVVLMKMMGLETTRANAHIIMSASRATKGILLLNNSIRLTAISAKALISSLAVPAAVLTGIYLLSKTLWSGTKEGRAAVREAKKLKEKSGGTGNNGSVSDRTFNYLGEGTEKVTGSESLGRFISGNKNQDKFAANPFSTIFGYSSNFKEAINQADQKADFNKIPQIVDNLAATSQAVADRLGDINVEDKAKELRGIEKEIGLIDSKRLKAIENAEYGELASLDLQRAELVKQQGEATKPLNKDFSFVERGIKNLEQQKQFLDEDLDKRVVTESAYNQRVSSIEKQLTILNALKNTLAETMQALTTDITEAFANIAEDLDNGMWSIDGATRAAEIADLESRLAGDISSSELERRGSKRNLTDQKAKLDVLNTTVSEQKAEVLGEESDTQQVALEKLDLDVTTPFADQLDTILNDMSPEFLRGAAEDLREAGQQNAARFLDGLAELNQTADDAAGQQLETLKTQKDYNNTLKEQAGKVRDLGISLRDLSRSIEDTQIERQRFAEDFPLQVKRTQRDIADSARDLAEQYQDFIADLQGQILDVKISIAQLNKQIADNVIDISIGNTFKNSKGFGRDISQIFADYFKAVVPNETIQLEQDKSRLDLEREITENSRQIRDLARARVEHEENRLEQLRQLQREQEDFNRQQRRTWEDTLEQMYGIQQQAAELGISLDKIGEGVTGQGNNLITALNEVAKSLMAKAEDLRSSINIDANSSEMINALRRAIIGKESNGNFRAINYDPVKKGLEPAYGYGQVLGNNIPTWTKQALGYSMTPQEFLNDSHAQIDTINHKLKEYYTEEIAKTNGDKDLAIRRVASKWYSGNPDIYNSTRSEAIGANNYPSIDAYTKDILDRVKKELKSSPLEVPVAQSAFGKEASFPKRDVPEFASPKTLPAPPEISIPLNNLPELGTVPAMPNYSDPTEDPKLQKTVAELINLRQQEQALKEKTNEQEKAIALITFVENLADKKKEISEYFRNIRREAQDTAYELEKLQANAKGYLTFDEEVRFARGDTRSEYNNRIRQSEDKIREQKSLIENLRKSIAPNSTLNLAAQDSNNPKQSEAIAAIEYQKELIRNAVNELNLEEEVLFQLQINIEPAIDMTEANKEIELEFQNRADELGLKGELLDSRRKFAPDFIQSLSFNDDARQLGEAEIQLDYEQRLKGLERLKEDTGKLTDEYIRQRQALEDLNEVKLDALAMETNNLVQIFDEVAQPALNGLLDDFINKSVTAAEAWSNFARSILTSLADILMAYAKNALLKKLFTNDKPDILKEESGGSGFIGDALNLGATILPLVARDGADTEAMVIPYASNGLDTSDIALAKGLKAAIVKESHPEAFPAVLHKGEVVLTDLNGDAQLMRSLKTSGEWNKLKSGTMQPNPIPTYRNGSAMSEVRWNGSEAKVINNNYSSVNVTATDANSFRKTQDQIAYELLLQQKNSQR